MLDLLMVGTGLFGTWGSPPPGGAGSFWADVKPTDYAIAAFTLLLVVFNGLRVEPLGAVTIEEIKRSLAHIGIRNTGKLPARDVYWRCEFTSPHTGDRKDFDITSTERGGPYIIPSGTSAKFGTHRIPEDKILRTSGSFLEDEYCFVWGEVHYNDGFGEKRYTKFCHRYPLNVRMPDGSISSEHARYHEFGNDAD